MEKFFIATFLRYGKAGFFIFGGLLLTISLLIGTLTFVLGVPDLTWFFVIPGLYVGRKIGYAYVNAEKKKEDLEREKKTREEMRSKRLRDIEAWLRYERMGCYTGDKVCKHWKEILDKKKSSKNYRPRTIYYMDNRPDCAKVDSRTSDNQFNDLFPWLENINKMCVKPISAIEPDVDIPEDK